jgi:hypothetical protein
MLDVFRKVFIFQRVSLTPQGLVLWHHKGGEPRPQAMRKNGKENHHLY